MFNTPEFVAKYKHNDEPLPGGVTKRTLIRKMNTAARLTLGIATRGISEVLFKTKEESYKYYYKNRYLGTTENEAAQTAYTKGVELCKQGKFRNAKKWFNAAYQTCTSDYENEETFRNSRHATQIATSAWKLYDSGRFRKAAVKFQKASNLSSVSTLADKFSQCKDTATNQAKQQGDESSEDESVEDESVEYESSEDEASEEELSEDEASEEELSEDEASEEELSEDEASEEELSEDESSEGKHQETEKRGAESSKDECREFRRKEREYWEAESQKLQKLLDRYQEHQYQQAQRREADQRKEFEADQKKEVEADQRKEVEGLKLHKEGTDLYLQGKMKKAAHKLEEALEIYGHAAATFDEAFKKTSDSFFISYTKLIEALMENGAYDQAGEQLDKLKIHFHDEEKKQILKKMEELINDETWSPNCLSSNLTILGRTQTQTIQISNWSPSE
ncbi:unnamed protein product [Rotaria magnacalcarata]|uniref:Uncharacterized protein n=2 Tax=Rotaria magnacalcarata TaxID=392030 RepID=A0A814XSC3_9BILA|nr:unnamed protein product [Rotaria magnacalcarata]CAF3826740.1 unnamed protein product [Rotaria magnacalcarata]